MMFTCRSQRDLKNLDLVEHLSLSRLSMDSSRQAGNGTRNWTLHSAHLDSAKYNVTMPFGSTRRTTPESFYQSG